ncbi:ABC transporter ATP-binding protein [Iamia sp. SCSIO 61187]|uniref:ABC transporter ATP-binding protein n=1 Tax=Iamia sp. SCSIO 61187 TaxID=2722752 RepID=UPI001C62AB99|nr:ABC transporter ATP-binding protein [Iamia sp. SCSIO 61187]QYG94432.1 ABC transporter ATP-binding protein [Iamia sp. SCSIO 61187]
MTAALSVRGLVAGYGGVPVVRAIELDVSPDTFLAVVGANGAGKSTTLRAIMGLCEVFAGTVELGGTSLDGTRTSDRVLAGLALCPEGREVFPSLSVEENLLTGAIAGQGWTGRRDALDRVYELLPRLGERRGQSAGTMSGGEQQQLAVGRALMSGPTVLLVDEASLGLAPVMVDRVFEILANIHASGTAVVAVEQNIRISSVATHIVVLEQGTISDRLVADDVGGGLYQAAQAAYFGTGGT